MLTLCSPLTAQPPSAHGGIRRSRASRLARIVVPVVVALAAPAVAALPAADAAPAGRYVVLLHGDADPAVASRAATALGGTVVRVYRRALAGYAVDLPPGAAARLARVRGVDEVEPDTRLRVAAAPPTVSSRVAASWGVDRLDQVGPRLDGTFTSRATGAGVEVDIVDTGINLAHKAFGGRAVTGIDLVDGGPADDCNGHGTHVAGTAGGGLGLGVAPEVRLVAVRVLGCDGSGRTSDVLAGIEWVTQHHAAGHPTVANLSLGGGPSAVLDAALRRSIAAGVTWVVAAGNDGTDACSGSPARVATALTVGATDRADRRTSWSDRGRCVDLFAPGAGIVSAWLSSSTATRSLDGTSMAAPHVTGIVALWLQLHPGDGPGAVAAGVAALARHGIVGDARAAHADLAAAP